MDIYNKRIYIWTYFKHFIIIFNKSCFSIHNNRYFRWLKLERFLDESL